MAKPTIKKEVAVDIVMEIRRAIYFFATADAVRDFIEYGELVGGGKENYYRLGVDGRWDFQEVLNFIQDYDSQNRTSPFEGNDLPAS